MRAHNFSTRIQLLETWGAVLNWQSGSPSLLHQPLCHGLHQVDLTDLQLIENGMALPVNQILSYTGDHRCMKKYESSQQRSKMKLGRCVLCLVNSVNEPCSQVGSQSHEWRIEQKLEPRPRGNSWITWDRIFQPLSPENGWLWLHHVISPMIIVDPWYPHCIPTIS